MAQRTVTIYVFIPGEEWLMTTASVASDRELQQVAEDFAARLGGNRWTELRVYTQPPEWQAKRGRIAWNSSGVTPYQPPSPVEPAETTAVDSSTSDVRVGQR